MSPLGGLVHVGTEYLSIMRQQRKKKRSSTADPAVRKVFAKNGNVKAKIQGFAWKRALRSRGPRRRPDPSRGYGHSSAQEGLISMQIPSAAVGPPRQWNRQEVLERADVNISFGCHDRRLGLPSGPDDCRRGN